MVRVGIAGAAGYTAGELLRILINHPQVEIAFAQSSSNTGNPAYKVHADLFGETDLVFCESIHHDIDVLFLCMGHGQSTKFMAANPLPESIRVIDLGNDFRLKDKSTAGGRAFVYGLPELNREAIKSAKNIANPGCFATAIQLALLPIASAKLICDEVHVNAVTGSTGAGQALSDTTHYTWRNNNLSAYKVFSHQHLGEIGESLCSLQGFTPELNFVPLRGCFTRGIFVTVYTKFKGTQEEALALYQEYYKDAAFTFVSTTDIDMKQVVNSNKCLLQVQVMKGKLFVTSVIDNLVKGASGQAVHNMNLMFGLPEHAGLRLKAPFF